ncbi:hypothetical protein [Sinorhizobium fredii]|uniref:hypothetical protein n=1 Tax=Rhizobium fredii TaxID=380 RepID=UPI003511D4AB
MSTIPDVFIIESLDPDDEGNGRFEGSIISNMLRLHGKSPMYRYVRTRDAFEQALKEFGASNYRYLHISAHGEAEGMSTTNLEEIDFDELGQLLKPYFRNKRLFLSACSMVHEDLAAHLIPHTDCYSVVGPVDDIHFHKAAIFWASVYHLLFVKDSERIQRAALAQILGKAAELFEVNVRYFSKDSRSTNGFREQTLRARGA